MLGRTRGAQYKMPHLTESQLEYAFIAAFNEILAARDDYFTEYETVVSELTDTAAIDREAENLAAESAETYELLKIALEENARKALDQDEYGRRFGMPSVKYEAQRSRLTELAEQRQCVLARRERLNMFLDELRSQEGLLTEFDESLFRATADIFTVHSERDVAVKFRDGTEISVAVVRK
jgi:hypothetical protein